MEEKKDRLLPDIGSCQQHEQDFSLCLREPLGTIWGVKIYYTKVQPEGNLRERRPVTDIKNVHVYGRI